MLAAAAAVAAEVAAAAGAAAVAPEPAAAAEDAADAAGAVAAAACHGALAAGARLGHFPITIIAGIMAGLATFNPANFVLSAASPAWMRARNSLRAEHSSQP